MQSLNAILNRSSGSLEGAKLYVNAVPLQRMCEGDYSRAVSRKLCICPTNTPMRLNTIASKKMFDMVGIKYRIYEKTGRKLTIEL